MSKKEIFWLCMLLIGSVLIGRLLMAIHYSHYEDQRAGLTPEDLAGFNEPGAALTGTAPGTKVWPQFPSGTAPVLMLAAASTVDLLNDYSATFQKRTGVGLKGSTGGSNALAQQILNGAPADLFLSADAEWVNLLAEKGFVERREDLLGNDLVLIVPAGNPAQVKLPSDLLKPEMRHLALAGEKVPAGKYAEQALAKLGLLQGLTDSQRIVRGKDVRVAYNFVVSGEAQAGIVYASDAYAETHKRHYEIVGFRNGMQQHEYIYGSEEKIEMVHAFPDESHDPIIYTLVLIKREGRSPAAAACFDALCGAYANLQMEPERFGFKGIRPGPVKWDFDLLSKPATAPNPHARPAPGPSPEGKP